METQEGVRIFPAHVPSSSGDFASLRVEQTGSVSIGIYPLSALNLRQLAAELIVCALGIENAERDQQRLREIREAA